MLASAGFDVHAIDRNPDAIAFLHSTAERLRLTLNAEVADREGDAPPDLAPAAYDAVFVFNYLHRPLMPALRAALKPGGRLFYETFTMRQAERGHPKNPAFLLNDSELPTLVAPSRCYDRARATSTDGSWRRSLRGESFREVLWRIVRTGTERLMWTSIHIVIAIEWPV